MTNEILNYDNPYLGIDDLVFEDEKVYNSITGENYQYDATFINSLSMCIWESLNNLRDSFNEIVL